MAGQVVGGEVAFTGRQAGSTADDLIEGGMRDLMLGNDPATIALNPNNHAYGHSSQGPNPELGGAPEAEQPTLEQLEEMERLRQSTPQQPQQNWQQLYGQSENEKGELRRQLQLAEQEKAQIALQQQMLQAQMQMAMAQAQQISQPQPQQQYQPRGPIFPGKTREDVITLGEIEDNLFPLIQGAVQSQGQAAEARYMQLENQLMNAKKAQAGITPLNEFQILAENPWINGLNGSAKVDAMASVLALKRAQVPQAPTQQQPQPQAPTTAAPRRLLYVEPGRPTANEPRATDSQAAMQQEWINTFSLPLYGGKREAAQKAVLMKYGAQQVSGWRDPNILSS